MSLRWRITALYIAMLVPSLIAFSLTVNWIASRRLYNALDDSLIARIEGVRNLLPQQTLDVADIRSSVSAIDASASVGFAFKVVDPTGRVLYASSRPIASALPSPDGIRGGAGASVTWHSAKEANRIAYEPVLAKDGSIAGYVVGAVTLKQTDDAFEELRGVFVAGALLIVLLTSAPAYLFAGRVLRPVREVSAHAAAIERTADFNVTLPSPAISGETAELVATFNAMIGRVRRMLLSQRDFLAISSHELRRPLTVLRTYIDVLEDNELSEAERLASLQEMRYEAESMSRLIADLLLISREGEPTLNRSAVNLEALCARLLERLRAQDHVHHYRFSADAGAAVLGDPERLEQMVRNLLDNAAQSTPAEGTIDLQLQRENGTVRISVTDTGNGIPDDEQPRVFERFFRGRERKVPGNEGFGLGLVIVKHVAESHGGAVSFTSHYGSGSCFTIDLPAISKAN